MSKEIEQSFIDANGIRLHISEAGPKDGPLVILAHGFPEFWYGWRKQIPHLAKAGYHVIAPDQRGFNLSDKPTGVQDYDIDNLAKDLIAVAQTKNKEQFHLVGQEGATGRSAATRATDVDVKSLVLRHVSLRAQVPLAHVGRSVASFLERFGNGCFR